MKTKTLTISACFLIGLSVLYACAATAKSTPTIKTETVDNTTILLEQPQEVIINDGDPKYGKDSATCVMNISLYLEFYKQKNYKDAYEPWKWVFLNCPNARQNLFIEGATLIKYRINQTKDAAARDALIDTLMLMYDTRIKCQGKEGFVNGKKASDLFVLKPTRTKEIYDFSKKAIEMEKNKTEADVLIAHLKSAIALVQSGEATADIIVDAYLQTSEIADWNMKNNIKDTAYYKPAQKNIDILFDPFATCPDLIKAFTPKYNATPNDIELLTKITKMLDKKGCTDVDLFFQATESLHKLAPTAQSAFMMGKMCASKKMYQKAQEFYLQAIELYDSISDKADAYLILADMAFRNMNQMQTSRRYALEAIKLRPNDGRPYILIGDLYAASASSCVETEAKKEIESKVAYWAAVDKYVRAKAVDPSIESIANQRIATYSRLFPNEEIIFFHGLTKGQSYTVGCWINETTIVR